MCTNPVRPEDVEIEKLMYRPEIGKRPKKKPELCSHEMAQYDIPEAVDLPSGNPR